ncbi:putative odorant receptor 85e isoform X1 [Spodoptera litura]|uniref:Odorant receptor n=2 Tax=Spodoptera litura TaxID=69820 RepID=A0A9J7ENJ2_SPOLT|nr:putative odorant receptor 85e isoform X1 [Spodoptera litura]
MPLKLVACWDLFPNSVIEKRKIFNDIYLGIVLFVLTHIPMVLTVHLYTEWQDIMSSLGTIADALPLLVSLVIVAYYAIYRRDLYELLNYLDKNFKYRSARGLTNMTMEQSCMTARRFGRIYTACTMFSVTMYATLPVIVHLWTKEPIQSWIYMDVTQPPFFEFVFMLSCLAQMYVGLAMGQFGVFFASNSILICGQLDLLCCSLRNARYTALLQRGVKHAALVASHSDIQRDEDHNYIYNFSELKDSMYHYDERVTHNYVDAKTNFDIYSPEFDDATMEALRDCASLCQVVNKYKEMFESFVSPLLALRVVQVTLYLCTLLYAATLQFDMITVEYLAAVALDIFVYCYYGNQIILQADRVSTAAYQSMWHTMGIRPRKVLLNILLANRRPVVVRAGKFLPMDLHTFVVIIKTSFSYYTLLVNVNEK